MHKIAGAIATMTIAAVAIAGTANAGPFGYNAGDEMPPTVGTNNDGLSFGIVSPPPAGFDSLAVYGTEKTGICMIRVVRLIESDPTGREIKASMENAERALSNKYGEPITRVDNLIPGALYDEPREFMMSLAQDEREYRVEWKVDKGDISGIGLSAHGRNASDGYYIIEYQFTNYDECMVEVNSGL